MQSLKNNHQGKTDLKQANFKLGSMIVPYLTTNKEIYNEQKMKIREHSTTEQNEKFVQKERVNRQRLQNFTYGHDQPIYESIAKNKFIRHDLSSII